MGSGRNMFPTGWVSTDFHDGTKMCINRITAGRDGRNTSFYDGKGWYIYFLFHGTGRYKHVLMKESNDMHKTSRRDGISIRCNF